MDIPRGLCGWWTMESPKLVVPLRPTPARYHSRPGHLIHSPFFFFFFYVSVFSQFLRRLGPDPGQTRGEKRRGTDRLKLRREERANRIEKERVRTAIGQSEILFCRNGGGVGRWLANSQIDEQGSHLRSRYKTVPLLSSRLVRNCVMVPFSTSFRLFIDVPRDRSPTQAGNDTEAMGHRGSVYLDRLGCHAEAHRRPMTIS
ncbi:uncharacterized protein BJX67DRAFT_217147 [Aspergillus lucknowensis]|uniref:Uncharacterized protein n=1 Tax=Aspergillus lucknowensis TaxID=176173 RepID=A0ABR4M3F0_9EURO